MKPKNQTEIYLLEGKYHEAVFEEENEQEDQNGKH